MNIKISKPGDAALLVIVAAGLLWFLSGFSGEQPPRMTHVGGAMNHCTCTQRLER